VLDRKGAAATIRQSSNPIVLVPRPRYRRRDKGGDNCGDIPLKGPDYGTPPEQAVNPRAAGGAFPRRVRGRASVVDGLGNRAIADQLIVGEETVKTHLRSVYKKLDVRDRAQAVAKMLRNGIFA
jgi:Bacterial regulatory proteins, luxR family